MVNEYMLPLFIVFGPIVLGVCLALIRLGSDRRSPDLSWRREPTLSRKPHSETLEEMHLRYKEPRFDIRA